MAKKLTVETSLADLRKAIRFKSKLIKREEDDFLFALGKQWDDETLANYEQRKIKPVTDNRIQPNIFLLTGLERQNRSEFKAFPEGEEDSIKAEIASYLFKDAIKKSDFIYKTSEQFKDGITCGESHLELYLDYTYNILNGAPVWRKLDGNCLFPEPGFREYDYSDARYVYKIIKDLSEEDLISLYPEQKKAIKDAQGGKVDFDSIGTDDKHVQKKDYPKEGNSADGTEDERAFDLIERYYKKFVEKTFVADRANGQIQEAETPEKAEQFILAYKDGVQKEQDQYQMEVNHYAMLQQSKAIEEAKGNIVVMPPPPIQPEQRDPERFIQFTKLVPEIWCFAHVPGMNKPLVDEVAWFYPKWKKYPFIPYFARFSTAPLHGDDAHLLVQGIVHGVKNNQEILNKTKTLELLHLNTSTNSGWLSEEDSWVDPKKVEMFGATPGINLEYKKGRPAPIRQFPNPLSQGHAQIAEETAESIKAGLGINADLLAVQDGGSASGRAIALRQRQGLVMVQELFDNLSRSRQIAGKFLLSQMGEMYDTETAKKVLGEEFMLRNFGMTVMTQGVDQVTGQPIQVPAIGPDGQPAQQVDLEFADKAISEVLSGDLWNYDVSVGDSVSSETMKIANQSDLKDFAATYPGLVTPDILIEESQLPNSTKKKLVSNIKQAQQAQAMMANQPKTIAKRGESNA